MSKMLQVVCPHCGQELEVEMPAKEKAPRGALAGIALEDMTMEQLKREKINAGSVLYKAQKRGAAEETIAANQARFDAVVAMIAQRKAEVAVNAVEEAAEAIEEASGVYAEEI